MSTRRISLINFKGGVGKTSLTVNIAACLAYDLGQRVLVVDCDAQSNSSIWLMGMSRYMASYDQNASVYGVLTGSAPFLAKVIKKGVVREDGQIAIDNLDLLPAVFELMDIESNPEPKGGLLDFYAMFHQNLSAVSSEYDFILFDCPPNVFRVTKAALFASTEIYVPCNPDPLSNMGLALLQKKIAAFHNEAAPIRRIMHSHKFAKIRGAILNNVPVGNVGDMVAKIKMKIEHLRDHSEVVAKDASILPRSVRHALAATRAVEQDLPLVLLKDSELKKDYITLSRYIYDNPPQD